MNTNTLGLIFIHMVHLSHLIKDMKALIRNLRKEAVVDTTCWELKSHLYIQGFNAFYLHVCKLGRRLGKLSWERKVFEKGMKKCMMSHVNPT